MGNARAGVAVAPLVAAAAMLAGCAEPPEVDSTASSPASSSPAASTALPESLPTHQVAADLYFDPQDPQAIRTWGSYLVEVTLASDGEEQQIIEPAPGGPEDPIEGEVLRTLDFRVDAIRWTHPQAVSQLSVGDVVPTLTAEGFDTQLEVGGRYLVALLDDVQDEVQTLEYLDGSAVPLPSDEAEALAEDVQSASPSNPENVPEPGVSFGQRLQQFAMGGRR